MTAPFVVSNRHNRTPQCLCQLIKAKPLLATKKKKAGRDYCCVSCAVRGGGGGVLSGAKSNNSKSKTCTWCNCGLHNTYKSCIGPRNVWAEILKKRHSTFTVLHRIKFLFSFGIFYPLRCQLSKLFAAINMHNYALILFPSLSMLAEKITCLKITNLVLPSFNNTHIRNVPQETNNSWMFLLICELHHSPRCSHVPLSNPLPSNTLQYWWWNKGEWPDKILLEQHVGISSLYLSFSIPLSLPIPLTAIPHLFFYINNIQLD